jgi:hypothetical protein
MGDSTPYPYWFLLDSRGVDEPMASNLTFVLLLPYSTSTPWALEACTHRRL